MSYINIYSGDVVAVDDPDKLNRIKVSIVGYTEKLTVEELEWYYPWYGCNFIPIVGDVVSVMVLNDNFTTCFYSHKQDLNTLSHLQDLSDGTEYQNYLEIFKRENVELIYKLSQGIVFKNENSSSVIETDRNSMYVGDNQITMVKDRIDIGTDGEPAPLGDMTVEALLKHIDLQEQHFKLITDMLKELATKLSAIPMTKSAGIPLRVKVLGAVSSWNPKAKQVSEYDKTIRSKMVFIE